MARDRLNQWADQLYFNPTKVLEEAARLGFRHTFGGRPKLPAHIVKLDRKRLIEDLDAAVFAHALRVFIPERDVCIAEFEAQDHDFVLRFGPSSDPGYCPLQLKVLVSDEVNASLTLDVILDDIRKYADASDLVVAIKVDRAGVDPRRVRLPCVGVAELWFYGPDRDAPDTWYLYGDCLDNPQWLRFQVPGVE